MRKLGVLILSAVLMIFVFAATTAFAAEPGQILSFGTDDGKIVLYVQNPGNEVEAEALIGTSEPESVTMSPIASEIVPVRTIFMLDNSLSIKEKDRQKIKNIMTEIVANRMPGEQFTVATFDEKVNYLLKDCDNYSETKQAIDSIQFVNQDTYLTDAMYQLLTELNANPESVFTRIVLISDGVDNNYIGYSKNELNKLVEEHPYPIYTIGCSGNANSDQLKDMYALSRMTGAEQFYIDDIVQPITVVSGVGATNGALKVTLEPKGTDLDGSIKGVSLTLKTPDGDLSDTVQVQMPAVKLVEDGPAEDSEGTAIVSAEESAEEIEEIETTADDDEEDTDAEEDDEEDEEDDEDKTLFEKFRDSDAFVPVIIGIIVVIAAIVAAILISNDKKKKKAAAEKAKAEANRAAAQRARQENQVRQNVTAMANNANNGARPGATVMASQNGNVPRPGMPPQQNPQAPQQPQQNPQATQQNPQAPQQPQQNPQAPQQAPQQPEHRTVMMNNQPQGGRHTVMMSGAGAPAKTLVLQDMANSFKRFEVSLSAPALIGYNQNCQIRLNYEETVSGEHCVVYQKDDKVIVQNKSRTNGTLVDGVKITADTEIKTGSRLGVGRLTLTVEIK